jgi:hypothetical protein
MVSSLNDVDPRLDDDLPRATALGGGLSGRDLESLERDALTFVQERPFVALAGAVLAGFLVARLFWRR